MRRKKKGDPHGPQGGNFLIVLRITWNGKKIDQKMFQYFVHPPLTCRWGGLAEGQVCAEPGARAPHHLLMKIPPVMVEKYISMESEGQSVNLINTFVGTRNYFYPKVTPRGPRWVFEFLLVGILRFLRIRSPCKIYEPYSNSFSFQTQMGNEGR